MTIQEAMSTAMHRHQSGRFAEAEEIYRQVLSADPRHPDALHYLGLIESQRGRRDVGVSLMQQAIAILPDYVAAHNNLGDLLLDLGRQQEATAAFRRALELQPGCLAAHSNLLLSLHYQPGIAPETVAAEHRRWDEAHARSFAKKIAPHHNSRDPDRRLRIGYVSPDFRTHPVAFFFSAFLQNRDHAQAEVFCYSDLLHEREDDFSRRFRAQADEWRRIKGRSDQEVAEQIRADGIDILVDLAGHTSENRLLVFARKPAPVQCTCLGYCDTTGMAAMDFRLTDAHADPPGTTEHLHTERLVRLPQCAWCFQPPEQSPHVAPAPILDAGLVTFGCFNALPKITGEMLRLWSRLLAEVPHSRLLLKNLGFGEASARRDAAAVFENAGIAADRVTLLGHLPTRAEHLACHSRVDIALDTFPYHGTTTTCEALWMGVPVVTLAGTTHASRVGVSLLSNIGLPGLAANSEDDYVRVATELAQDIPRLRELRASLRDRMKASPLLDAPGFARNLEAAYRQAWVKWCVEQAQATVP